MPPPAATTKEFLSVIWGDQEGICSIAMGRPDPANPEKTRGFWEKPFAYPGELDQLLAEIPKANGKLNVYFGVCLKKERWPRKNSKGEEEKRATKENALSATAIWADIDFKTTALATALANLKAFPLKCSIGVLSGGGIQAFWLLREPASGVDDLARIERVNQALSKIIGGDHTQDTARVLRMPWTMNMKYQPAREASLAPGTWRPDLRYTIDDIEQYLPQDLLLETQVQPPSQDGATTDSAQPTMSPEVESLPVSQFAKRIIREGVAAYREFRQTTDTPTRFAEREAAGKMSRSEADCYIVTTLLQHQVPTETIREIFKNPGNKVGEKYREKKGGADRYLDHTLRTCQKTLSSQPKWQATSIAQSAAGKVDGQYEDERLKVTKRKRYLQEPPTYEITILFNGKESDVRCSLEQAYYYEAFKKAYFALYDEHLPNQKQTTWEKMYKTAPLEEIQVEKEEGTLLGQIELALNTLAEMAVGEKSGDISINHGAVRAESGDVVFKTPVLLRLLRDRGVESKKQDVIHNLKSLNLHNGPRRLGKRVDWVWTMVAGRNGQTYQPTNGTQAPHGGQSDTPKPIQKAPEKCNTDGSQDLFEQDRDGKEESWD